MSSLTCQNNNFCTTKSKHYCYDCEMYCCARCTYIHHIKCQTKFIVSLHEVSDITEVVTTYLEQIDIYAKQTEFFNYYHIGKSELINFTHDLRDIESETGEATTGADISKYAILLKQAEQLKTQIDQSQLNAKYGVHRAAGEAMLRGRGEYEQSIICVNPLEDDRIQNMKRSIENIIMEGEESFKATINKYESRIEDLCSQINIYKQQLLDTTQQLQEQIEDNKHALEVYGKLTDATLCKMDKGNDAQLQMLSGARLPQLNRVSVNPSHQEESDLYIKFLTHSFPDTANGFYFESLVVPRIDTREYVDPIISVLPKITEEVELGKLELLPSQVSDIIKASCQVKNLGFYNGKFGNKSEKYDFGTDKGPYYEIKTLVISEGTTSKNKHWPSGIDELKCFINAISKGSLKDSIGYIHFFQCSISHSKISKVLSDVGMGHIQVNEWN